MPSLSQLIGWAGMLLLVWAYRRNVRNTNAYHGTLYYALNVVGAVGLGIGSWAAANWPVVFLEAYWAYESLAALKRKYRPRAE